MIKNVPKTLKVLLRSESPEALKKFFAENPEVERYYNEFRDDGGKTGWNMQSPSTVLLLIFKASLQKRARCRICLERQRSLLRLLRLQL